MITPSIEDETLLLVYKTTPTLLQCSIGPDASPADRRKLAGRGIHLISSERPIRVLVTNARSQQAYAIVVGLRLHAERIVVASHGRSRIGAALAPSYQSRLVDARYLVPSPPKGWLYPEPTANEVQYVEALLSICEREALDLILPSADDVVYLLARQKARFADRGITVAVADFEVQSRIMDKAWMLRAAEQEGIPFR